jgi:BCD family chlorophyll transporter-like MFS transporter
MSDEQPAGLRRFMVRRLLHTAPRFLPFADVASEGLPLGQLLRLSLFQVSVGMALVLLVGTLNRVMIVELDVPASVVAIMLALPLLFAPFRALIGFKSDNHRSALGWRRAPYIWRGTMLQFGGFAIMPFALLVLAGWGESGDAPKWIGVTGAALAFLLTGAGVHMVQTVGLALATDLARPEDRPRVVGLMYVMLMLGMAGSAVIFGALLDDFSPLRLIQIIQGCAVVTIILNVVAIWKQEARNPDRGRRLQDEEPPLFSKAWNNFTALPGVGRLLVAIGFGTAGYGMADVLLEPYGGQVLDLSVASTTRLTATLAAGGIIGLAIASRVLGRGGDPVRLAAIGALAGLPGFALVILSAPLQLPALFVAGTGIIGFGAGIFGHATLTATMNAAPQDQAGLALGAWGAVQATSAGLSIAIGGIMRDVILAMPESSIPFGGLFGAATPYISVFALEMALLAGAVGVLAVAVARKKRANAQQAPLA